MKHITQISLFIIFCSFTSATLQCSKSEKIIRSTTVADIAITRNESDNFERHSETFNKAQNIAALTRLGLLDSPVEALKKHLEETKDISQATTAEEAVEIFGRPYIQKKSGNLPITTYVVLNDLPHIGSLLLDAGYNFDDTDLSRLKTQLNMLKEKVEKKKS